MPPAYLQCELDELDAERHRLDEMAFNAWFDGGPIKARFKKACMHEQLFRCCYCQRFFETMDNNLWDLEHILSESGYPQFFTEPLNLTVACRRCNNAKRQKDVLRDHVARPPVDVPAEPGDYTIPHPYLTGWHVHLRHTGHMIYEGLSPEGEELILCCELNGKAEEDTGVTAGAIRVARATQFFERFGARVPEFIDVDLTNEIIHAAVLAEEEPRVARMIGRVERELAKQARAAARRGELAQAVQF